MILTLALAVSAWTAPAQLPSTPPSAGRHYPQHIGHGAGRGMDRFFDMADLNHDGVVTRDEFHQARERFSSMRAERRQRLMNKAPTDTEGQPVRR